MNQFYNKVQITHHSGLDPESLQDLGSTLKPQGILNQVQDDVQVRDDDQSQDDGVQ